MTTADGTVLGATQDLRRGPAQPCLHVVLLGDGFTAAQQTTSTPPARRSSRPCGGTPPYDELFPAINIWRVNVTSTDSGADDPTSAGGTGATARTYFDSTFGGNGIRRLLVCNRPTVLTVAAAQVPEFTVAIVVVNSTVYGGSGGSVGTYSLAGGATEIAIHETGPHRLRPGRRVPLLRGRQRDRPRPPPGDRAVGAERHDQHQPRHAQVELGGRGRRRPFPTMSNPDCCTVDTRPSPCRPAPSGSSRAPTTTTAAPTGPSTTARCATSACRSAACAGRSSGTGSARWPTLQRAGPHADQRGRPLPRAPRRVRRRERRPHHVELVGREQRLGRLVPGVGRRRLTRRPRLSGHRDRPLLPGTSTCSPSAPTTGSTAAGGTSPAAGRRGSASARWSARPGSTVNVVSRYTDHLDLFTTASDGRIMSTWWDARGGWAADWFQVIGRRRGRPARR